MSSEFKKIAKAFKSANKRIAELERLNLGLANESHNKGLELAKANERLKESEQVRTEYSFLIADLVRRADVKDDLYKNPTYQKASDQLNKFAIDKKIEGVNDFCATLSTWEDVHPIGANYVTSLSAHRDSFNEQLRKEQDHE